MYMYEYSLPYLALSVFCTVPGSCAACCLVPNIKSKKWTNRMGLVFITSISSRTHVFCWVWTATLFLAFQLACINRFLPFSMHSAASIAPWWSRTSCNSTKLQHKLLESKSRMLFIPPSGSSLDGSKSSHCVVGDSVVSDTMNASTLEPLTS